MPDRLLPPHTLLSPALIATTQATLSGLHGQGRLAEDQLLLLTWLLEEARKSPQLANPSADGGEGEAAVPSGWADLPELAERHIFGPGTESSDANADGESSESAEDRERVATARLVCRSWKRAVSRERTEAQISPKLRHAAPFYATRLPDVFPGLRHLTVDLGLRPSEGCQAGTGAGIIATAVPTLERLQLQHWWMSVEDLEAIATHLRSLKMLSLSVADIPLGQLVPYVDDCLQVIGRMSSLEVLYLEWMANTSSANVWRPLGSLSLLRELHIYYDCQTIESALNVLTPRLPLLTNLTLGMVMTSDSLLALAHLPNLKTLDMLNPEVLLEVVPDLARLTSLRRLKTGSNRCGGGRMCVSTLMGRELPAGAIQAPLVEQLNLRTVKLEGAACLVDLAAALPGLVELTILNGTLHDSSLSEVSRLESLTKLEILETFLRMPIIQPGLQGMRYLKHLSINNIGTDHLLEPHDLPLLLPPSLEKVSICFWDEMYFEVDELIAGLTPLTMLKELTLQSVSMIGLTNHSTEETLPLDIATNLLKQALPHVERISLLHF